MSLTDDLRKDMFTFFKEGNTYASDILKMALASIKNAQIAQESEMTAQDEERIINSKIKELNISSMSDMGKLIGAVMKETAGKADGNTVKNLVTQILTK